MNKTMMLVAAVCLLAATACSSVSPPIRARGEVYAPAQINIAEESLRRSTAWDPPAMNRGPSNVLMVNITVRNTTNENISLDYNVVFVDGAGMQCDSAPRKQIHLQPNEYKTITFNSKEARAMDFRLHANWAEAARY